MWRFLIVIVLLYGCNASLDLSEITKGEYYCEYLNESINVLSDTVAVHKYSWNQNKYEDTIKIKYYPDRGLGVTTITLFSVSNKSNLSTLNYGLSSSVLDKDLFYTIVSGTPTIMVDPENISTYYYLE